MADVVTLAVVRTKNGMKASEIIAFLALTQCCLGDERLYLLSGERAMPLNYEQEIVMLACHGLNEGIRDRLYMMPLAIALERIGENPKKLTLHDEARTVPVYEPRNRTPEETS